MYERVKVFAAGSGSTKTLEDSINDWIMQEQPEILSIALSAVGHGEHTDGTVYVLVYYLP